MPLKILTQGMKSTAPSIQQSGLEKLYTLDWNIVRTIEESKIEKIWNGIGALVTCLLSNATNKMDDFYPHGAARL